MRFIDAAMECVGRGWSVFPLSPGSKFPAVPKKRGGRGVLDATRDVEQIKEWAKKWPRANVGLACGRPSGMTVIDIDPKNGGMQSVMALKDTKRLLTPTISVRTPSGGWHLYYAYEPLLKNSQNLLGAGIDVRNDGGYVVAPPSRLDTGKVYSWHQEPLDGYEVPRMPRWAFEKLKPKAEAIFANEYRAQSSSAAMEGMQRLIANAKGGERNSCLYWAARRCFSNRWTDQGTQMMLVSAACAAGLSQKESWKTVGSAYRAVTGMKVSR